MSFDGELTFRSVRSLKHAPGVVFGAFADAEKLARWWGPSGFRSTFHVFEFRSGGRWSFVMHGPDGKNYPNETVFEVVEPTKLVLRHAAPDYRLTITLSATATGTDLTWEQRFDNPKTAAGIAHIVGPANEQNLDRLEGVLTSASSSS